jgi:hypothetical protein
LVKRSISNPITAGGTIARSEAPVVEVFKVNSACITTAKQTAAKKYIRNFDVIINDRANPTVIINAEEIRKR